MEDKGYKDTKTLYIVFQSLLLYFPFLLSSNLDMNYSLLISSAFLNDCSTKLPQLSVFYGL